MMFNVLLIVAVKLKLLDRGESFGSILRGA